MVSLTLKNVLDFVLPTKPTGDFNLKIFGTFNESFYDGNKTENVLTIQPQISYWNEFENVTSFKVIYYSCIKIVKKTDDIFHLKGHFAILANTFSKRGTFRLRACGDT